MQLKTRPITVYCSEELYQWIERYAAADQRSMSGWISRKLDQARERSAKPAHEPLSTALHEQRA